MVENILGHVVAKKKLKTKEELMKSEEKGSRKPKIGKGLEKPRKELKNFYDIEILI